MRNGSGTYTLASGNPVITGTTISSTWANNTLSDIATALTSSIAYDGQTNPIANLPMAGFKLTGLAAATANGDAVRFEQLFTAGGADGALTRIPSVNGGQLAGNRRKGINGDFSINQLAVSGTVVLAAGVYGHDGWKAGAGGCTYTFATVNNLTTVTITAGTLLQVLEGIKLQSGTYTLSWGGTAQGRWDAGSYAASGVQGTVVGGTDINIEFGTGTLLLVQPEPGTTPTAFEFKDDELSLCQRYYETGDLPSFVVVQTVLGVFPGRTFATPKRVVPAMTLTPASGGGATVMPGIAGFYQSTDHSGNAQCAWAASARM